MTLFKKLPCTFERGMSWRLKRLFVKTVKRWKVPDDHLIGVTVTDKRPVNYRITKRDGEQFFVERGTGEDGAAIFDFDAKTMKNPMIHLSPNIRNDPEGIVHEIGHYRTMAFIDREPNDPLYRTVRKVQDLWKDGKVRLGEMGLAAISIDDLPSEFLADCYMVAYCGTPGQWLKLASWCLSKGLDLVSVLRLPETFRTPSPTGCPEKKPAPDEGSRLPGRRRAGENKKRKGKLL